MITWWIYCTTWFVQPWFGVREVVTCYAVGASWDLNKSGGDKGWRRHVRTAAACNRREREMATMKREIFWWIWHESYFSRHPNISRFSLWVSDLGSDQWVSDILLNHKTSRKTAKHCTFWLVGWIGGGKVLGKEVEEEIAVRSHAAISPESKLRFTNPRKTSIVTFSGKEVT